MVGFRRRNRNNSDSSEDFDSWDSEHGFSSSRNSSNAHDSDNDDDSSSDNEGSSPERRSKVQGVKKFLKKHGGKVVVGSALAVTLLTVKFGCSNKEEHVECTLTGIKKTSKSITLLCETKDGEQVTYTGEKAYATNYERDTVREKKVEYRIRPEQDIWTSDSLGWPTYRVSMLALQKKEDGQFKETIAKITVPYPGTKDSVLYQQMSEAFASTESKNTWSVVGLKDIKRETMTLKKK